VQAHRIQAHEAPRAQAAPGQAAGAGIRKRRVLFLINSLVGGGAERVMSTLLTASAAESREFDISFATLDIVEERYNLPDWLKRYSFDCGESLPRSLLAVRRLMADVRPDVVLSFLSRANVANVALSPFFGARSIISERVNTSAHFTDTGQRLIGGALVRLAYPHAARIIAVSAGVADDLADNFATPREKIVVIDNPVDIDAIRAKAAEAPQIAVDQPYVLAAGRLTKNKNFEMLVAAFAASGVPGKLVILGVGPMLEALRAQAEALGLADRVLTPGFVANPYALMRRAQVFVLPSNAEGFPNGLVEAMAAGAPVISTNCASGPSEILAERPRGELSGLTRAAHGLIVSTDAPGEMAEALRLMQDPALRQAYAEKAGARVVEYGVEKAKNRYWDVVRAALA
jgi:glycosyltransferase involved in cell wall biosynthesis